MKRFLTFFATALALAGITHAVVTNNIPISQMVITTNVLDEAYFPLIQPWPGRITNDNFRATTADLFSKRPALYVTNLTVYSNTVNFNNSTIYGELTIYTNVYITNGGNIYIGATNLQAIWQNTNSLTSIIPGLGASVDVGLSVGPAWMPDYSDGFVAVHDQAQGESATTYILAEAIDNAVSRTNMSKFQVSVTSDPVPFAGLTLAAVGGSTNTQFEVLLQPDGTSNIKLTDRGLTNFMVANGSGYTATGTNFLSDDGTYKAANFTNHIFTGNYWTNDYALRPDPALLYNFLSISNHFNYGWNVQYSTPITLTNGTNTIDSDLYSGMIIDGATPTASDSIIRLKAATFQGASLRIAAPLSLNNYTLPNGSSVAGAGIAILNGDWIGGTNQVIDLSWDGWNWKEVGRYTSGGASPATMNPTDFVMPVRVGPAQFGDSQLTYNSTTNQTYLRSTDPGNYATIQFINTNAIGGFTTVGKTPSGGFLTTTGGQLDFSIASGQFTYSAGMIAANLPNTIDLGHQLIGWKNQWLDGTNFVIGYQDSGALTNYQRLATYSTGTNGAVVFDSQASGTAGAPRPFQFQIGATNTLNISRTVQGTVVQSPDELYLEASTGYDVRIKTGGVDRWEVDLDGHLLTPTGGTYNLGVDANGQTANSPSVIAATRFLVVASPHTPASSGETNYIGTICWDASYLYVWTSTNVNKRIALTSW